MQPSAETEAAVDEISQVNKDPWNASHYTTVTWILRFALTLHYLCSYHLRSSSQSDFSNWAQCALIGNELLRRPNVSKFKVQEYHGTSDQAEEEGRGRFLCRQKDASSGGQANGGDEHSLSVCRVSRKNHRSLAVRIESQSHIII